MDNKIELSEDLSTFDEILRYDWQKFNVVVFNTDKVAITVAIAIPMGTINENPSAIYSL